MSSTSTWTARIARTSSTPTTTAVGAPLSASAGSTAVHPASNLDPSIDFANGYLHVLYKDDSAPSDGTAITDRYRYVRNTTPEDFRPVNTPFNTPVTVIERDTATYGLQAGQEAASPLTAARSGWSGATTPPTSSRGRTTRPTTAPAGATLSTRSRPVASTSPCPAPPSVLP